MYNKVFSFLAIAVIAISCKPAEEENTGLKYDVPTSYNFQNVSYSGQTYRLKMLEEMETVMVSAKTTSISASTLKEMFSNTNAPFTNTSLNTSGKQLKDKCFLTEQAIIEKYIDSLALSNANYNTSGSNGVAGLVTSTTDNTRSYLLSPSGFEYAQIIEKSMMMTVFYYQMTGVYLTDAKTGNTIDNDSVTVGEGTTMEHHWDEAYGYTGLPKDYPTNTNVKFLGEYIDEIGTKLGTNQTIHNAFIKGRAAISNKDLTTKDEQRHIIVQNMDKLIAATVIHELNQAKANIGDNALRCHYLSEAYAFALGLRFNPSKAISDTQLTTITNLFGNNFYTISTTNINSIITKISTTYGLDSYKSTL